MDDETVLIVFGDHGMTDDGNHGGGTENELKSVVFSYCKQGFPWATHPFLSNHAINQKVKQLDLASSIAGIFNLSIPF